MTTATTSRIDPKDIKWRVGSTNRDKTNGLLLGYIDAREAMERLDELDPAWSDTYTVVTVDGHQGVQCALTVNGVTRTDVGVPSNTEGLKGAYSDALKRAAVKHNIGRELYELPTIWVEINDRGYPQDEPVFTDGKWVLKQGKGTIYYEEQAAPDVSPQRPQGSPQTASRASGGEICPIHGVEFFKSAKMRGYAHPIKEDGVTLAWCNKADVEKGLDEGEGLPPKVERPGGVGWGGLPQEPFDPERDRPATDEEQREVGEFADGLGFDAAQARTALHKASGGKRPVTIGHVIDAKKKLSEMALETVGAPVEENDASA